MIAFILVCFGITFALVYSKAFRFARSVRGLKAVLTCAQCTGFWVGILVSAFGYGVFGRSWCDGCDAAALWDGFLSSGTSFLLWLVAMRLGAAEY